MASSQKCCSYKSSRRGLIVMTLLTLFFSLVFMGIGGASLTYGSQFKDTVDEYCQFQCSFATDMSGSVVGCDCESVPEKSTLPYYFYLAPSIGLIIVGVFAFFTSLLGCLGAVREKAVTLSIYLLLMFIVIVLQFAFGVAAAVATTAGDVNGPIKGILEMKYKRFDWLQLDIFFPESCYKGMETVQGMNSITGEEVEIVYHFPLCSFEDKCAAAFSSNPDTAALEEACCDSDNMCDTSQKMCNTGGNCLNQVLGKVGAPVAVVAFLALCIEVTAFVFACVLRFGSSHYSSNKV